MSEDKEERDLRDLRDFLWSSDTITWFIIAVIYICLFLMSLKEDKRVLAQRAKQSKKAQPKEGNTDGKSD